MTSNEDDPQVAIDLLRPVIKRASRSVAYQWPGVIDAEDTYQAIYLRLLESPGSVQHILQMEDKLARYRAVVGIGHQLASQERTDYDHFKGSYRYSVSEVRGALKRGVLTEPVDGYDELVIDLMEALEALTRRHSRQYVDAVTKRFADEVYPETTRDKDALKNGMTALADEMNRSSRRRFSARDDGPGTRKVLSRAQATELTSSEWDGDDS